MHRPPLALGVTCCRIMHLATGREKRHHATGAAHRARKWTSAAGPSDQNAVRGNNSTSFSEPLASLAGMQCRRSLLRNAAHLHSDLGLLTTRTNLQTGGHSTGNAKFWPPPTARARARRGSRRPCHHDFCRCHSGAVMAALIAADSASVQGYFCRQE